MTDGVGLGNAQPKKATKAKRAKQPTRRVPQDAPEDPVGRDTCCCGNPQTLNTVHRKDAPCFVVGEDGMPPGATSLLTDRAAEAQEEDSRGIGYAPPHISGEQVDMPVNPYAPTGWGRRNRNEFDVITPIAGQRARVMRLERDDLLRLDLMEKLNTFAPMLLENQTEQERNEKFKEKVKEDPGALKKMYDVIDMVVMAVTIKPRVTNDETKVNYGSGYELADPNFVATAFIEDIDLFDRMFIFGAAFGRSMDDLKSLFNQAQSLAGVGDVSSLWEDSK